MNCAECISEVIFPPMDGYISFYFILAKAIRPWFSSACSYIYCITLPLQITIIFKLSFHPGNIGNLLSSKLKLFSVKMQLVFWFLFVTFLLEFCIKSQLKLWFLLFPSSCFFDGAKLYSLHKPLILIQLLDYYIVIPHPSSPFNSFTNNTLNYCKFSYSLGAINLKIWMVLMQSYPFCVY